MSSKNFSENNVGWIERETDDADAHIGIAHGNIEGLGLGVDKYFNMTREELTEKKLDLWLLGHIHVPYPGLATFANEKILMPGTHSPDGFDRERDGGFFDIRFDGPQKIDVAFKKSGNFNFRKLEYELNNKDEIQALKLNLDQFPAEKTLLKLTIKGRLDSELLSKLTALTDEWGSKFLFFERTNNVAKGLRPLISKRLFRINLFHTRY